MHFLEEMTWEMVQYWVNNALHLLSENGILYENEVDQTKKVLTAAALTYVAAAAASVLQLVRLIILFGGRNRD